MRILQAFDFFTPHGGGTVDAIYKLSQGLAQSGHEVTLYTSDFKLDQSYINSLPEVKTVLFQNISRVFGFYVMTGFIKAIRENLKDFDIVHLQCARSFQNIVVHHYAMKYKIPYVLDTHGSLPRVYGKSIPDIKRLVKWLYDVIFGYRIYQDARRVVAETDVGVREYKKYGVAPSKIVKIPTPIDTDEFSQLPHESAFKQRYNLQGKHLITFLGRINWIKGLDFITESFAKLAETREDIVLVIIGNDDGYKAVLEKLINKLGIKDKVLFTGFLGGKEKLAALVEASVVVQASFYEQGVRVAFEAIMCNVPVIVTTNTGPGEIIKEMGGGYTVAYGNGKQLKDIIQYILDNRDEALLKTQKAKEYIKSNLSLKAGVQKFEELYRQVLLKGV